MRPVLLSDVYVPRSDGDRDEPSSGSDARGAASPEEPQRPPKVVRFRSAVHVPARRVGD